MTKQFRIEHNLETGEVLEIELTAEEIAELQDIKASVDAQKQVETIKAVEKAALLAKLGITDDEAKLLLS